MDERPSLGPGKVVDALESVIMSGDRIVMEGDNQKQADFLSRSLVEVDAKKVHDLYLIISSISRPEHLPLFELGIARKVDFAFAGPEPPCRSVIGRWRFRDRCNSHVC